MNPAVIFAIFLTGAGREGEASTTRLSSPGFPVRVRAGSRCNRRDLRCRFCQRRCLGFRADGNAFGPHHRHIG